MNQNINRTAEMNIVSETFKKNQSLILSLKNIKISVENVIKKSLGAPDTLNIKKLTSLVGEAKKINKEILDNTSTINALLSNLSLGGDYYEYSLKTFLKKTEHVDDDIPDTVINGAPVHAIIRFKNMGMYYSWNESKGIALKISIIDFNDQEMFSETFPLDLNYEGNEPYPESTNEDFSKIKTFEIDTLINIVAGTYKIRFQIIDSTGWNYSYAYSKDIELLDN